MESPYHGIVSEYFDAKFLSGLGYTFDSSALTDFEISCLRIIESEMRKLQKTGDKDGGAGPN